MERDLIVLVLLGKFCFSFLFFFASYVSELVTVEKALEFYVLKGHAEIKTISVASKF